MPTEIPGSMGRKYITKTGKKPRFVEDGTTLIDTSQKAARKFVYVNGEWKLVRSAIGPYSAIVKKEGTDVWAEDEYGKTIAEGEAGVDDAEVMQSVINNIASLGGGKLLIKNGTYYIKSNIDFSVDNLIIQGETFGGVILKKVGDVRFANITKTVKKVIIRNLYFDCSESEAPEGASEFCLGASSDCLIENIYIYDFPSYGMTIGAGSYNYRNTLRNIYVSSTRNVNDAIGGGKMIYGAIENVFVLNSGFDGVGLSDCQKTTLKNVFAENCQRGGVVLDGWKDCRIENIICYKCVEDSAWTDFYRAGFMMYQPHTAGTARNTVVNVLSMYNSYGSGIAINVDGKGNVFKNLVGYRNYRYGIIVKGEGLEISGCVCAENGQDGSGNKSGLFIDVGSKNITISGGIFYDDQDTKTQNYCIRAAGTDTNPISDVIIKNCQFISYATAAVNLSYATIKFRDNIGYVTENSGTATFSGDGSTTQFKIEHGLVSTPSKVQVTPMTADAAGDFYVTVDDTYIYVNYKSAPASGTDNIKLNWLAEV